MAAGDLITQLQDCNTELCAHLFNFTGAIQRDAPPLSVVEEPLEQPQPSAAGAETVAQVPELASQIVRLSKQFDELANHLPEDMPPREQQLQNILKLQEEVAVGRQGLLAEVAAARMQLQQAQQLYGQLADDLLRVQDPRDKAPV